MGEGSPTKKSTLEKTSGTLILTSLLEVLARLVALLSRLSLGSELCDENSSRGRGLSLPGPRLPGIGVCGSMGSGAALGVKITEKVPLEATYTTGCPQESDTSIWLWLLGYGSLVVFYFSGFDQGGFPN